MNPSSEGGGDLTAEHQIPPQSRNRLHNFSFPSLRWGSQRILRCKSPVTAPQKTRPKQEDDPQPSEAVRSPWNLRTRRFRSSCNEPPSNEVNNSPITSSPPEKSARMRSSEDAAEKGLGRERFSVSLSREEIEEDFVRIKGVRPQRRPKKRARIVQRKLDKLFPGMWLYEITEDSYKTND